MRAVLLLAALALAACASPRQACLRAATTDLRNVETLIAETQANLARGYAIAREPYVTTGVDFCYDPVVGIGLDGGGVHGGLRYCNTVETRYRTRPVAIDLAAERRKLAELQATRARLAREAERRLAACPPPG